MTTSSQGGLFPEPELRSIRSGDHVIVQTIYGLERGIVIDSVTREGWPALTIDLENGDRVTMEVGWVQADPDPTTPGTPEDH